MVKVTLYKYGETWNYFTEDPKGGGFVSNYLADAIQEIPAGAAYLLIIKGHESLQVKQRVSRG
jgi:hypothetical protein